MILSARSMIRSICISLLRQTVDFVAIPDIPRAFFIWSKCVRQISSKANPCHAFISGVKITFFEVAEHFCECAALDFGFLYDFLPC